MNEMKWSFSGRLATLDDVCIHVNPGWRKLVTELVNDLFALGWNGEVSQVKEKFGALRFYISSGNDAIYNRIQKAEKDSCQICEFCGETGKARHDLGWISTLCNKHYEDRKNGIR